MVRYAIELLTTRERKSFFGVLKPTHIHTGLIHAWRRSVWVGQFSFALFLSLRTNIVSIWHENNNNFSARKLLLLLFIQRIYLVAAIVLYMSNERISFVIFKRWQRRFVSFEHIRAHKSANKEMTKKRYIMVNGRESVLECELMSTNVVTLLIRKYVLPVKLNHWRRLQLHIIIIRLFGLLVLSSQYCSIWTRKGKRRFTEWIHNSK